MADKEAGALILGNGGDLGQAGSASFHYRLSSLWEPRRTSSSNSSSGLR